MRFLAIDVETANADMASICSIGVAAFEHGKLSSQWYSLIDPNDYFDPINVSIHGIQESDVRGAPTFKDASSEIDKWLGQQVVVTHTHFDRVAIHQAAGRWSLPAPTCTWLDSARVARRTWAECAKSGYGLANVCKMIGYTFDHHNALEDAKASGHVLLAAMQECGLNLDAMLKRVVQPINPSASGSAAITRDGNPDGPVAGEVIVFTGALEIPRREAADLAASVGCDVANSVTKKTTLLVVGDMDVLRLVGHDKSSKLAKPKNWSPPVIRCASSARRTSRSWWLSNSSKKAPSRERKMGAFPHRRPARQLRQEGRGSRPRRAALLRGQGHHFGHRQRQGR